MNRITEDELVKLIEMGLQTTLNLYCIDHIEIQPDLIWIKNTDPFDNKDEYQEMINRMGYE